MAGSSLALPVRLGQNAINYASYTKEAWRRWVYNTAEAILGIGKAERWLQNVAYLDAEGACETKFLLDRGYSSDRIWLINKDEKILMDAIKELRWDGYNSPNSITVGNFEDLVQGCSLDIVNFDGMGSLGYSTEKAISKAVLGVRAGGIFAVNLLAKRDGPNVPLDDPLYSNNTSRSIRVIELVEAAGRKPTAWSDFSYHSSVKNASGRLERIPMLSVIMQVG